MSGLKVGELADRTGTSAPTIRYYEQIGLLRRAPRQAGNQRVYTRGDIERLTFIRRCREFDFSIGQVRALVALLDDPRSSCMEARDLAASHLDAVRVKMRELKALEKSLVSFVMTLNLFAFVTAAFLEIAGCFAFWTWLRQGRSPSVALLGVVSLIGFAVMLTRVDAPFAGRAYAAYGGIYIASSLAWLWAVEGNGRSDQTCWVRFSPSSARLLSLEPRSGRRPELTPRRSLRLKGVSHG